MKFKSAEIYRTKNGYVLIAQQSDRLRDPRAPIGGDQVEYCFGSSFSLAQFIAKNIEEPDDFKFDREAQDLFEENNKSEET